MTQALRISGLGDLRRDQRGTEMIARMVDKTSARLRVLATSRAEEVAYSRFLTNPHFGAEDLRAGLRQGTLSCCAGRGHVLVLQDTSEINVQHHAGRVRDLGPVGNGRDLGLFVHAVLALDASDRTCLGLLDCMPWVRPPQTRDYRKLPVEAKESYRWLKGAAVAAAIAADMITLISDRESDRCELFARRVSSHTHVLIGACRDRALGSRRLFKAMSTLPASFCYEVPVPARRSQSGRRGHPARRARLQVRFGPLELRRPVHSKEAVAGVPVFAVDVAEIGAEKVAPEHRIHWRLLTTHAVEDAAMARQVIAWYSARWTVEQLFRNLKGQGLDLEASQSEDGHALLKLAVMATHAATRILQLVQARDGATGLTAAEVFEPDELETMAALLPEHEGNTALQQTPHPPDTLAWCAWIIARLGGWKGYRNSEGPPGPLTMRRGYEQFCTIHNGYALAKSHLSPKNVCKP
jgi:hypothetical protein